MRTVTVTIFETAKELVETFAQSRMPAGVYLVVEGHERSLRLSGEGAEDYELDESITFDKVFEAAMKEIGVPKVHWT